MRLYQQGKDAKRHQFLDFDTRHPCNNILYDFMRFSNKLAIAFCFIRQAILYEHDYDLLTCATLAYVEDIEIDTSSFTSGLTIVHDV